MAILPVVLAMAGIIGTAPSDTSLVLGVLSVDLTGDGIPEVMELLGEGPSVEELRVTLLIRSEGTVLYRTPLAPLTPTVGFGARRHRLSAPEYERYLSEFGEVFFSEDKVLPPSGFLNKWQKSARLSTSEIVSVIARDIGGPVEAGAQLWTELQTRGALVFEYSPGGDRVVAIAWSESAGTFVNLVDCC